MQSQLETDGHVLLRGVVKIATCERFLACITHSELSAGNRARRGATYAIRGLLWSGSDLAQLLAEAGIDRLVSDALGSRAFPVDALLFDKNPEANWKVPGHQDLVMPVAAEVVEAGFEGWVNRNGICYVELPGAILESMVAARIHLDDSPADNGALAVVSGSHRRGKMRDTDLQAIASSDYRTCDAARGDVLLMRPLLVHRSSPSRSPQHRRVLHVVYAIQEPGERVRWRVQSGV